MKRKGFTLIDLLAVIVILAIIAVIATPIIVGIIEDSRKAAFERSVKGIMHAIDLDFGTQEILETYNYEIENGEVTNTILKAPIQNLNGFSGTIKYDENGYEVYYDVSSGTPCTNYDVDNSKTGYNGINGTGNQTSCLKFYAFNYKNGDTKVKLLLDHNTTGVTYWNENDVFINNEGPKLVLTQLQTSTNSWIGTLTPDDYTVSQPVGGNYTIDYSTYKARLITANEIAEITNNISFDEITSDGYSGFYFDTNTKSEATDCKSGNTSGCSYRWLYDRTATNCVNYGCLNNSDTTTGGYWTATSVYDTTVFAWCVPNGTSMLSNANVGHSSTLRGVRPVIEVLKSNLEQ